jgi:hypothetical protein
MGNVIVGTETTVFLIANILRIHRIVGKFNTWRGVLLVYKADFSCVRALGQGRICVICSAALKACTKSHCVILAPNVFR